MPNKYSHLEGAGLDLSLLALDLDLDYEILASSLKCKARC